MPAFTRQTIAAAALAALHAASPAALRTWDGNGGSDNWSFIDAATGNTNWTEKAIVGNPLPLSGDGLVFGASTRLTPNNDLAGLSIAGISFSNGAGAYTLSGLGITLTRDIRNNSAVRQTITMPLTVGADQFWDGGSAGLAINGGFTLGSHALTLDHGVTVAASTPVFLTGSLTMRRGSTLSAGGVQLDGTVALGDAGTQFTSRQTLYVGTSSAGGITAGSGASLDSAGVVIGYFTGSSGQLSLADTGTAWRDSGNVIIGLGGSASLAVTRGAQATLQALSVGATAGSSGSITVDGAGSTISIENANAGAALGVPGGGAATIAVSHGGQFVIKTLAQLSGAASSLTVSDAGSLLQVDGGLSVFNGAKLTLAGGRISADLYVDHPADQFRWTGGELDTSSFAVGANGLLGSAVQFNGQQSLHTGSMQVSGLLSLASGAVVQAGRLSINSGSAVVVGGSLTGGNVYVAPSSTVLLMPGGTLSGTRWTVDTGATISGGRISLQSGQSMLAGPSTIASGLAVLYGGRLTVAGGDPGATVIGAAGSSGAVDVSGRLALARGALVALVSDQQTTVHGVITLDDGTRLSSLAGIHLFQGATLGAGNASIDGSFINDGSVSGQGLTFLGNVSGSGSFSGVIQFQGHFDPTAAAAVNFGQARVTFDRSAVVTLDIGSNHDELAGIGALQFDGWLVLAFDSAFRPVPGQRIALFDFESFSGSLDAAHVSVQGFDAAQLDLSRLGIDGTIAVQAVPEPASAVLMAFGLAALRLRRRRR